MTSTLIDKLNKELHNLRLSFANKDKNHAIIVLFQSDGVAFLVKPKNS